MFDLDVRVFLISILGKYIMHCAAFMMYVNVYRAIGAEAAGWVDVQNLALRKHAVEDPGLVYISHQTDKVNKKVEVQKEGNKEQHMEHPNRN